MNTFIPPSDACTAEERAGLTAVGRASLAGTCGMLLYTAAAEHPFNDTESRWAWCAGIVGRMLRPLYEGPELPVVLVGPARVGKTHAIKAAATLCGELLLHQDANAAEYDRPLGGGVQPVITLLAPDNNVTESMQHKAASLVPARGLAWIEVRVDSPFFVPHDWRSPHLVLWCELAKEYIDTCGTALNRPALKSLGSGLRDGLVRIANTVCPRGPAYTWAQMVPRVLAAICVEYHAGDSNRGLPALSTPGQTRGRA